MTPNRHRLPVPKVGQALTEAGDAYVASLVFAVSSEAGSVSIDGANFERLIHTLDLQHLCFKPRTREAIAGTIPARRMAERIDAGWAGIESSQATAAAEAVLTLCRIDGDLSWSVANL